MNERRRTAAQLVAFAALAAFATAHWGALLDPAPARELVLATAAALAGCVALAAVGTARLRRLPTALAAAGCALATLALALAAVGVPAALLWPGGWGELAARVDLGLAGLAGDVDYPYGEDHPWSRLVIASGAPLALGCAAALTFWPAGERARRRLGLAGLAVLVVLYAIAAAANPPDGALARGVILLALIAAWLWLPALRWRDALLATGLIAAAGALAVPAAADLRVEGPWLDYRSWTLRSAEGTTYRWEHSYGPIDWPRDGTQMLAVTSDEPHYWKTVVLDRFNGVRWIRSEEGALGARDVSAAAQETLPPGSDPRWLKEFAVAIGNLESEVVVGAGTPTRILGVDEVVTAPDGTTVTMAEPLRSGDTYRVRAYIPDPSDDEMRSAPQSYPDELATYTRIALPGTPGEDGERPLQPETVTVPLRGVALREAAALAPRTEERIARSPYGEMFELSRRLVDGQPTAYDAVRAIHDHLRSEYDYSEFPPRRDYPLASFLAEDGRGYCQQFSGAMALMLRMAGIPSRVVGGFAPGTRDRERGVFRVEDFDAHSWVEVYFAGIGWVAFDPTPAAAPVSSQQPAGVPGGDSSQPSDAEVPTEGDDEPQPAILPAPGGGDGGAPADLTGLLAIPAALLAMLGVGGALVALRARRHRRLDPTLAAAAQLDELAGTLERFGWPTSEGATLLALERRLRRGRRRAAARYVERLRALRYSSAATAPPSLAERRALRRELASTLGVRGRLRALIAVPPGGPLLRKR